MASFITRAPRSRRTLIFGSTMHVWSDLFFALLVPLLPFIKEDMGLSFTQVGMLRSVFSGASAILQVPAGLLAESAGEFWMLILGNVWVSAGLVAMALAPVFVILVATSRHLEDSEAAPSIPSPLAWCLVPTTTGAAPPPWERSTSPETSARCLLRLVAGHNRSEVWVARDILYRRDIRACLHGRLHVHASLSGHREARRDHARMTQ